MMIPVKHPGRVLLVAVVAGCVAPTPFAEDGDQERRVSRPTPLIEVRPGPGWEAVWKYSQRWHDHDAMPGTLYASTPSETGDPMCPVVFDPPGRLDSRHTERQRVLGKRIAQSLTAKPSQTRAKAFAPGLLRARTSDISVQHQPVSATTSMAYAIDDDGGFAVPFFPAAGDTVRQGFVRVINHSPRSGQVRIDAIDDAGDRHEPITLDIGADATVHFNSDNLESGAPNKGLSEPVGTGVGDWRLQLTSNLASNLDIEVLAYVRTSDGFLTAMHDVVADQDGRHRVPTFNPANNPNQVSRLRLVNRGEAPAAVKIRGIDDTGVSPGGEFSTTIPALASSTFDAHELEAGTGSSADGLGNGTGKWRLEVESEQDILVMSLLANPTGHLTNLSTAPANGTDGGHTVPLFPATVDANRQGFVRIINRSDAPGEVRITARDDTDWDYPPISLSLAANAVAHFNSDDLEFGNPDKGLASGVGSGRGDWHLKLDSDLDIGVLAYIRTAEGFLTSMHDVAPSIGTRHRVVFFNPGSNQQQVSGLRLVNPGDGSANVTITGIDETGHESAAAVEVSVPGGQARTITAQQLETGGVGQVGTLGDGRGKWQLNVRADHPLIVMSLLTSPTGHLTNLSTAPDRGADATADEVFEVLLDQAVLQSKCVNCHVAGGESGTTRLVFVPESNPNHQAQNLEAFRQFLRSTEDGAALILDKIQGVGHGGGVQLAGDSVDFDNMAWFLRLLEGEIASVTISAETLFDTIAMASARTVLRRAALIFAGRIPTAAEYESAERGRTNLRAEIRNLMTGPKFHDFLIRAANDRLLTDRHVDDSTLENRGHFFHYDNKYYRLYGAAVQRGEWRAFNEWHWAVQHGAARAPLELIAHVVENDLPYAEVLTADYVMANRLAMESYGGSAQFNDPDDVHEFQPTRVAGYYTKQPGYQDRFEAGIGLRVIDPGPGKTAIPHAGLLNMYVFLKRYPTTATNRNRARARWTYYHFLGVDIENAASRSTDPVALADTDNPTMNNGACTVCHSVLDPAAGAFQNYGDIGLYRDQFGGMDSLDPFYKNPAGEVFAIEAESFEDRQTVSSAAVLDFNARILIEFTNDYSDDATGVDRNLRLDTLDVRDSEGLVVFETDLAELKDQRCGQSIGAGDADAGADHWAIFGGCGVRVDVEIPAKGTYDAVVTAWADQAGDEPAKLKIAATPYRYGDPWYRDMREPGFDGARAADAGTSLAWLAREIVAHPRFAEATVKFWWPAIMGRDVAEPPQDKADVDFDGLLLAANAQAAEVNRLAEGLRTGFDGGAPYNLKDLLVETVLSKWFRAESSAEVDPVHRVALAHAGVNRLLTPEELALKTASITGFQWGRWVHPSARPFRHQVSALDDLHGYRLLYGGIDSDGIIDRAGDLTSVMASVAKSHAVESSCPIVFREFYMLPDGEQRLFDGLDKNTSPVAEFGDTFEIEAESWDDRQTFALRGRLSAGTNTVWLSFPNDYYNEDSGADRNVRLDALVVKDADGTLVDRIEFEDLEGCGSSESSDSSEENDHRALWQPCELRIPVEIPEDGIHDVGIIAWADQAGGRLPLLDVAVESNTEKSAGAWAIRNKLVELHDKLLGVEVAPYSEDVEQAYQLFVEVWERKRESGGNWFFDSACNWGSDFRYFDGILDDALILRDEDWGSYYTWDWGGVNRYLNEEAAPYDSAAVARTWSVVLAYLLMDYRYLYL